MTTMPERVLRKFLSFKYEHKETKEKRVERLTKELRDQTGLSKGLVSDIADAIVRGRDVFRLAIQKNWPIENHVLTGPTGSVDLYDMVKPAEL